MGAVPQEGRAGARTQPPGNSSIYPDQGRSPERASFKIQNFILVAEIFISIWFPEKSLQNNKGSILHSSSRWGHQTGGGGWGGWCSCAHSPEGEAGAPGSLQPPPPPCPGEQHRGPGRTSLGSHWQGAQQRPQQAGEDPA